MANKALLIFALSMGFFLGCEPPPPYEEDPRWPPLTYASYTLVLMDDAKQIASATATDTLTGDEFSFYSCERNAYALTIDSSYLEHDMVIVTYDSTGHIIDSVNRRVASRNDNNVQVFDGNNQLQEKSVSNGIYSNNLLNSQYNRLDDTLHYSVDGTVTSTLFPTFGQWYLKYDHTRTFWSDSLQEIQVKDRSSQIYRILKDPRYDSLVFFEKIYPLPSLDVVFQRFGEDSVYLEWEATNSPFSTDSCPVVTFYTYDTTLDTLTAFRVASQDSVKITSRLIDLPDNTDILIQAKCFSPDSTYFILSNPWVSHTRDKRPDPVSFRYENHTNKTVDIVFDTSEMRDFSSYVLCYEVEPSYITTTSDSSYFDSVITVTDRSTSRITIPHLDTSLVYHVALFVYDTEGNNSTSEVKTLPGSIRYWGGLGVTPYEDGSLFLKWSQFYGANFAEYQIRYSVGLTNPTDTSAITWKSSDITDTSVTLSNIPINTERVTVGVFIQLEDSTVFGVGSRIIFNIQQEMPAVTDSAVTLSWYTEWDYNTYYIFRTELPDGDPLEIDTLPQGTFTWTDTTVVSGEYQYGIGIHTGTQQGTQIISNVRTVTVP